MHQVCPSARGFLKTREKKCASTANSGLSAQIGQPDSRSSRCRTSHLNSAEYTSASARSPDCKKKRPDTTPASSNENKPLKFSSHLRCGAADIRLTTHTEHCVSASNDVTRIAETIQASSHQYWGQGRTGLYTSQPHKV